MKNFIYTILFAFIFFSCSSNKSTKQLEEKKSVTSNFLFHSTLYDWIDYYQPDDCSFSLEEFKLFRYDSDELKMNAIWEDWEPDSSCLYVYSPNRDFYINLDTQNFVDDGIYCGSDIDTKVFLVDIRKKMTTEITSAAIADDAFWVNDSVFALLEISDYYLVNDTLGEIYITIWDIHGRELAGYRYEGSIEAPKYPYLHFRFMEKGIKFVEQASIPENLPEYFQSLIDKGMKIPNHMEDSAGVSVVIHSFSLLQEYVDGKINEYPTAIVKEALGYMMGNFAYNDNWEMLNKNTDIATYAFFEAYLDQVCRLCPDANLIATRTSPDGQIGVFDIYNFPAPCYPNPASSVHPHLIYKDDCQGYYRQKALDDVFDEIIEIDREDVRYYLLANLNAYFGAIFSLLTSTSCGVKECLEPTYGDVVLLRRDWFSPEFYEDKHVEETKLIFNPKDLTWKACRKNKKGDWADFPDSKTFRLKFEDKIKIVMD